MDWFFDEWLYRMGHPVFRVTQNYDATAKTLKLVVRQEQKPDPNSDYPQVAFFRTPVDVEIGTSGNTRVERVMIEPKEEQTFTFPVDSLPMLVNFDYGDMLIKELKFDKPTDDLIYQATRDDDSMGRLWALGQLSNRLKETATTDAEKSKIAAALGSALNNDKFWGVRTDVATARTALLAATKDKDAHVRTSAINALAKSKDPQLASVYQQFLNDPSYATVSAAALALGDTKSQAAYDALVKLIDVPSWRDQIRAYALSGLARLGDKRALDLGIRFAAAGNQPAVSAAAITLVGAVGKDDPRSFPLIAEGFRRAVKTFSFQLANASGNALVKLGDQRGIDVIEQGIKSVNSPQFEGFLRQFQQRLRQASQPAPKGSGQ